MSQTLDKYKYNKKIKTKYGERLANYASHMNYDYAEIKIFYRTLNMILSEESIGSGKRTESTESTRSSEMEQQLTKDENKCDRKKGPGDFSSLNFSQSEFKTEEIDWVKNFLNKAEFHHVSLPSVSEFLTKKDISNVVRHCGKDIQYLSAGIFIYRVLFTEFTFDIVFEKKSYHDLSICQRLMEIDPENKVFLKCYGYFDANTLKYVQIDKSLKVKFIKKNINLVSVSNTLMVYLCEPRRSSLVKFKNDLIQKKDNEIRQKKFNEMTKKLFTLFRNYCNLYKNPHCSKKSSEYRTTSYVECEWYFNGDFSPSVFALVDKSFKVTDIFRGRFYSDESLIFEYSKTLFPINKPWDFVSSYYLGPENQETLKEDYKQFKYPPILFPARTLLFDLATIAYITILYSLEDKTLIDKQINNNLFIHKFTAQYLKLFPANQIGDNRKKALGDPANNYYCDLEKDYFDDIMNSKNYSMLNYLNKVVFSIRHYHMFSNKNTDHDSTTYSILPFCWPSISLLGEIKYKMIDTDKLDEKEVGTNRFQILIEEIMNKY